MRDDIRKQVNEIMFLLMVLLSLTFIAGIMFSDNLALFKDDKKSIGFLAKYVAYQEKYHDNCVQISRRLASVLRDKGYDVKLVSGYMRCSPDYILHGFYHEWVIVNVDGEDIPIEATTGTIMTGPVYGLVYKLCYVKVYDDV